MKNLNRITSAALSLAMLAGMAAVLPGKPLQASAATTSVRYSTVINKWGDTVDKKAKIFKTGYYWNHPNGSNDPEKCSTTPCNHAKYGTKYCNTIEAEDTYNMYWQKGKDPENIIHNDMTVSADKTRQCFGFARKLSNEFWGTTELLCVGRDNYEPRVGDHVRLKFTVKMSNNETKDIGHSIFITAVSKDGKLTFAECNGDMEDCKIAWGSTEYYDAFKYVASTGQYVSKGKKITVDLNYLKNHLDYAERPMLKGDFDLDGKIDDDDVKLFRTSYMETGSRYGKIPEAAYDVNNDGKLTDADYSQIRYYAGLSYVDGYIFGTGPSVTSKDRNEVPSDGFLYNNGIYKKLDSSTATFLGAFYSNETSFVIKPSVYLNGTRYTVTTIGNTYKGGGPGISPALRNLKTIGIPDTVTTIKRMAFSHSTENEDNLTQITFTGSNPGITTIEEGAFYNSTNLTGFPFAKCKNLKTIGSFAFQNCGKFKSIDLSKCTELTSLGNCAFQGCGNITGVDLRDCAKLTSIGDAAFKSCNNLTSVIFPITSSSSSSSLLNMKYGTTYGMFEDGNTNVPRTKACTLNFLNANSPVRTVVLCSKDVALWRNRKLNVVVCGSVYIRDTSGKELAHVDNSQMIQVYPK